MKYGLAWHDLGDGLFVLSLTNNGQTALEHLHRKRQFDKVRIIENALRRLIRNGTQWGFESETLMRLDGVTVPLAVCELKVKTTTVRMMTYLHNDEMQSPVLLFYFEGHQISSHGGISPEVLKKGERLAQEAHDLLANEEKRQEDDTQKGQTYHSG